MHYLINAQVEKVDMLPSGGLEAYHRSYPDQFLVVKMGKIFETFWTASTHYLINAWLEKGGMVT